MLMLDNRVLIRPIEQTKTSGGIYLPDKRQREPTEHGIVVSVGLGKLLKDGKTRAPMQLKPGDEVVMHYKHVGVEVKIADIKYRIMRETDVLVKV